MLDQVPALLVLQVPGLRVGHPRDLLEPLLDVALPGEAVQRKVGGVALQARPRLLLLGHPPRLLLVEQRVDVAPPVAVVDREGVAGEDPPEPRVPVELLLGRPAVAGPEPAPAVLGGGGERGPEVGVVLRGPVLAPDLGIGGVLGHLDQPDERLPRLLLPLEDVREQGEQQDGHPGGADGAQDDQEPGRPAVTRRLVRNHVGLLEGNSAAGAVARAGVAVQAVQLGAGGRGRDRVDEGLVAAPAVDLDQLGGRVA